MEKKTIAQHFSRCRNDYRTFSKYSICKYGKTAANESDLTQAISEASDQTTIKLTDSFTLNDKIAIADGKKLFLILTENKFHHLNKSL